LFLVSCAAVWIETARLGVAASVYQFKESDSLRHCWPDTSIIDRSSVPPEVEKVK